MKKLQFIAYGIFLTGLFLKFLHLPRNAYIMMAGILILLIIHSISAFKKKNKFDTLKGFATASWMIFLLFVLKFWPFLPPLLVLSSVLTVIALREAYRLKELHHVKLLVISSVMCMTCYLMPADERYELINIKCNHHLEKDYFSWDKYSWFLYQNGHTAEAVKASDKALEIAIKSGDTEYIEFISRHNKLIKDNNWISFR